jgi:hypothetical protein
MRKDGDDFDFAMGIIGTIFWAWIAIFRLLYVGLRRLYFFWRAHNPKPFVLPLNSRFAHMHIVAGSGYGKTQLLQQLILFDIDEFHDGKGSIVVMDSQGDLIRNITQMVNLPSDRVVIIDPNDVEHPPALNLFDFGLDRLESYSPVEQEKLINGAIALYEYLFGALLGAELTARQGLIFRFLARLMMVIPGATIHTLIELIEDTDAIRSHLHKLDPTSRLFFEKQFFAPIYDNTRQQIVSRLWMIIGNRSLERMFANPKNKLNLFEEMNKGSIILINTAKDLLKQEGCEIFGRFFIALISQAVQERAAIAEHKRKQTFIYIDEAQDYFRGGNTVLEQMISQARKQKVGLILSHQSLSQLDTKLRETMASNTAIKMVGGLSPKDEQSFAQEMRCPPEFFEQMTKGVDRTEFACFIRNVTKEPISMMVKFGEMESRPKLTDTGYQLLLDRNRKRVCASQPVQMKPGEQPAASTLELPDAF